MEIDNCFENQLGSCPRALVKPMSLAVSDHHGSQPPHARSSALRVSPKSKAPSPPGLKKLDSPGFSQWSPGSPRLTMDQKENLTEKDLTLAVVLPDGEEKMTVVHGSKPLMDLLVTLCGKYHLNPSSHTLELVTGNRNSIKLKPNALIGTLEAEKIILKPKGEDKNKKTGPKMPEATVRMVINYKKTQKTILRVNPRVPLAELLPAICEKCEFDLDTTVLLKDVESLAPLDLSNSLHDYAIREIYAKDTKGQRASPVCPASPSHAGTVTPGKDKNQKEKENKGLFSMFRKSRKKSNEATTSSAPASPVLVSKPRPLSMALPSTNSQLESPTMSIDVPKKRRAPQPPLLVSQSCTSDPSTRRRLYSEPGSQVDGDQMTRLSRGSSAESSLRRTKRKAPPPPTSPTVTVQETVALEENLQGGASDNTLEEIMEQEETTPSLMSATASDTQGEDSSLSMSADVSLHSPSPETEIVSMKSVEGNGEDQSCDLSSDGNVLQSTVVSSAALGNGETTPGTCSSDLADTDPGPCQSKNISQQSICEEAESAKGDYSHFKPVMQDAEAQASVEANTETPWEQTDRLESPVVTSVSRIAGEDAQVQTDLTPAVPPQQRTDIVPPAANTAALESAGRENMATLTDELHSPDLKRDLFHTSEASSFPDPTPGVRPTAKAPSIYAADSEPKPKPSNELTRNYIPKVGMTTYTIVPQKSLEKLRYFEVALTLEAPPATPEGGLNIDSLQIKENSAQTEVSQENTTPREDVLTRTAANPDTVNGTIPESCHSSLPPSSPKEDGEIASLTNRTSQAGSPAEVKEIKIPPATKPKPGSFRLAQHKKIPGYYVTSAAEKSLSAIPGSIPREAQDNSEREKLPPPPLPPPLQYQEETTGVTSTQLSPREDDKSAATARLTRQSSLPCKEARTGLSLEKLRSFAAPRPFSPSTPSRFAQAVSSAVKRSQSLSHGPKPPHSPVSPPYSPNSSHPSVTESKVQSVMKDSDISEVGSDKGSTLKEVEGKPQCFSEIAQVEEESSP